MTRWVSGTVFADGRPRIVNIKGIRMDAEFGPSMIYITNLDKPGFIGRFSSTLGDAGINIATFHVGREAPGGSAIALIEIDGELPAGRAGQGAGAAAGAAGEAAAVLSRCSGFRRLRKQLRHQRFRAMMAAGAGGRLPCLARRHPLSGMMPHRLSRGVRGRRRRPGEGFCMANVVVVGSQWGDEGKGKIVDWLSEQADVVVRFQGGHNAGHTLVIDGVDLQAVAAAVRRGAAGKLSVIGNGVVLDPRALIEEIDRLKEQGVAVTPDNLRIAENATLILPLHQELDVAAREARPARAIGTTGRGIGPAYEDKVGRRAIRLMDLADLPMLNGKIERLLAHHNALRRGLGLEEIEPRRDLRRARRRSRRKVLPFMDSVWSLLDEKRREGKRILFEGAQGALLDIDHGTYPYVTSSNTVAAQAATGSGLGPGAIGYVLGICKAYTTRVGEGPFPTEQQNEIGKTLGERGQRVRHRHRAAAPLRLVRRRAGAPDRADQRHQRPGADQARHPGRLRRDQGLRRLPARRPRNRLSSGRRARPGPGRADLRDRRGLAARRPRKARSWAELPAQAIKYVRRIEELVGCPVALLSTSPEREDTILMQNPFET